MLTLEIIFLEQPDNQNRITALIFSVNLNGFFALGAFHVSVFRRCINSVYCPDYYRKAGIHTLFGPAEHTEHMAFWKLNIYLRWAEACWEKLFLALYRALGLV